MPSLESGIGSKMTDEKLGLRKFIQKMRNYKLTKNFSFEIMKN